MVPEPRAAAAVPQRRCGMTRRARLILGTSIAFAWLLIGGNWLVGVFSYGPSPGGFLFDIPLVITFALTVGTLIGVVIGFVALAIVRLF
jgi:hypothetical protein